ncbi:MAG: YhdP family protein, partial [Octadecabacter sp.]
QLRADVALLSGRSYVTTAELTYSSPRGARTAELGVSITDAAAADIASQSPVLSWLEVLDAPISGALRGQLDEDGKLTSVSATLQIGAGELRPNSQTRPIPFESARTYISYDPLAERLTFDLFEVDSAFGRVAGSGRTYLREFENGRPLAVLGQLDFSDISIAPQVVLDDPVALSNGSIDFRLRLDPFTLDIGQAVVVNDGVPLRMDGQVRAEADGWSVALNVATAQIGAAQVMALWPPDLSPRTRDWLKNNVRSGDVMNPNLAFRIRTDARPSIALSMELRNTEIGVLPSLPPIVGAGGVLSIIDRRVAVSLDAGYITAPEGGRIELAGSTMVIPVTGPNAPARFDLSLRGRVTAAMAILNLAPFRVLRNSDLPVSFAQGQAQMTVALDTPLGKGITPDQRVWSASADLRDVRSDALIPNRTLTATRLEVRADAESLLVRGPMRMGDVGGTVVFSRALGAGSEGTARVTADTTISPAALRAFNIALPDGMLTGETPAQIAIDLTDPAAAGFRLTSDLRGAGLSLAGVGWNKARSAIGALTIVGQLGATPRIDQLSISAPGLQTTGTIRLAAGGGLERASFERVRLGGWLDAPVVLIGRGAGRPVRVQIAGGSLDLRSANFGGGSGGGDSGEGAPLEIALDRLRITDTIQIDNFRGTFTSPAGLQGQFQGNVNGATPIRGTLVPMNGQSAVRIVSNDAGGLLRATGLLRNAYSGDMQLTLIPTGAEGTYDGTVIGSALRVQDAPMLANLLDAISVVGLITQMDGQGILFSDVDAKFRLTPDQVIVTESSAVGPGLGISLDGIYWQGAGVLDFQGVVSPLYIVNQIGSVFTRRGEGLIGFNFNIRGPVDNPQVTVNPLSALTPGMFRDIFRRPPPTVSE